MTAINANVIVIPAQEKQAPVKVAAYRLTKSISRFGRNTLPLLQNLYELSQRGIIVRFDPEDFDTDESDKDITIATLAAIYQGKSERKSKDIKWGICRNFEKGKVQLNHSQFLGYGKDKDRNSAMKRLLAKRCLIQSSAENKQENR